MHSVPGDIPRYFCWTRFGTEAAQSIQQIFARKEEERLAAQGVFLWGVGNAVGRSLKHLLRICDRPQVLFTSMKSPARPRDVNPPMVVAWTSARTLDGTPFQMPDHALVTSRFDPASPKSAHYALVCHTQCPLDLTAGAKQIAIQAVRNLVTGRPVTASQVTAVVRYDAEKANGLGAYSVAVEADLVPPYFIRLEDPIPLLRGDCLHPSELDFAAAREEVRRRITGSTPHQMGLTFSPQQDPKVRRVLK